MKARFSLLIIGLVSTVISCTWKEDRNKPVIFTPLSTIAEAGDLFYQSRFISNALGLEPRDSDGKLMFTFETASSSVSYKFSAEDLDCPDNNLFATTETVPGGTSKTRFHMDFPLTVGKDFPEEILDVQSILLGGGITFSFTLDPDFPYQEARIEQATLTLPSWVREEFPFYTNGRQMDWPFPNIIHPGEVNSFTLWYPYNDYVPKEGEGIQEPGHRMVLDATVSIDGILSVDKKKRKDPQTASDPWSATFYYSFSAELSSISKVIGHLDLSRSLADQTLFFSETPAFLRRYGTVLDLDDIHGKLSIWNKTQVPVSISGTLMGDDREYPFSMSSVRSIDFYDFLGEDKWYYGLLSEKGGRVTKEMEADYQDVVVEGLSGLIDSDPVSFAIKDVRITNDTGTPYTFIFGNDNKVTVQASIQSPLRVGKDFQVVSYADLMMSTTQKVVRLIGSYTVENSLPFDYEIRPVFFNWEEQLPISFEPVRIPAGSRESPYVQTITFDWPVDVQYADLALELKGQTAEGRQGEDLYKDQHIAVKDILLEVYYAKK